MVGSQKKVILFIDDDEDDRMLFRDLFKECSPEIEFRWAADGEQALDYLIKRPGSAEDTPSVILLDLNMPKINGREVLKQIRNHKELSAIPVVVLSNSMNKEEALEIYHLGANSFTRKPAGYKELREFVSTFYKYWFEYSMLNL